MPSSVSVRAASSSPPPMASLSETVVRARFRTVQCRSRSAGMSSARTETARLRGAGDLRIGSHRATFETTTPTSLPFPLEFT